MTLEDEEGLTKDEHYVEDDDNDVESAETAQGHGTVFNVLHQKEAVMYHASRPESCTSMTVAYVG